MTTWKWKNYRQILDNTADGIYLVDLERKFQYWNIGAESITGFSAKEIVGKPFDQSPVIYEDSRGNKLEQYEHPVALCFQEKKPVKKNFFIKTKDNGLSHVEETATPLYKKKKIIGVVATFRDISNCIQIAESELKTKKKERLIPICGWCKKIRTDENYWEQLEVYLTNQGFGVFSHGICPACADKIFDKKVYMESYQTICKAISSSISLDEVLQLIVTNVTKVMNVKASLLRLLNKETRQLEVAAHYGLSEKYVNKGPVKY